MMNYLMKLILEGLVENKGILYIWNDKDLKSRELEINVRNELGVQTTTCK